MEAISKGAGLQQLAAQVAPFDTLLHYALRQAQDAVPQLLRMLPWLQVRRHAAKALS